MTSETQKQTIAIFKAAKAVLVEGEKAGGSGERAELLARFNALMGAATGLQGKTAPTAETIWDGKRIYDDLSGRPLGRLTDADSASPLGGAGGFRNRGEARTDAGAVRHVGKGGEGFWRLPTAAARLVDCAKTDGRMSAGELSFGEAVRAFAIGDWSRAEQEYKAIVDSGGTSGGGMMVPVEISSRLIDRARARSVAFRAGVQTLSMDSNTLRLMRLDTDPTAHWRREGAPITEDTAMAFGALEYQPKTLGCIVPTTIELLEDAPNAGEAIENAMAAAMALALDQAFLTGGGGGNAAEPTGLRYTEGVNEIDLASTAPDFDNIVAAAVDVWEANGEPTGVIVSPAQWGRYSATYAGDGHPLNTGEFQGLAALQWLQTSSLSDADLFVGDFSQAAIALRTSFRVEVLRSDNASVSNMLVKIRAYLRADVGIERPSHFTRLINATLV